jgi:hypothetical protein
MRIHRSRLDDATERWQLVGDRGVLDFSGVLAGWIEDREFRTDWIDGLREVPFGSYCWECRSVSRATGSRAFECVFVESPELARLPPDPRDFSGHFRADASVASFANLGGDATLVAPCPGPAGSNYSHLASFTATAPPAQQDALWRAVGEAMQGRLGEHPVWLSTAGLGVAWLHIRLDSRPKYYRHAPYRGA